MRRADRGEFLEYDEHFGNFYGTPKSFVREALKEKSVILEIDVVGALNAKEIFSRVPPHYDRPPFGRGTEKTAQRTAVGNGRTD